jgi:2-dehydropantoate 2-reductase
MLGAGGVGGYFGARLVEAGVDVTFLVRPERAALLALHGLQVGSPHGDFRVEARCVTAQELARVSSSVSPFDAVLMAPKAYDLQEALSAVEPAIGPNTFIVPLLNGLAHLDVLDSRFGAKRVVGGVAHVAATLLADGSVQQLNPVHVITLGGREEVTAAAASEMAALFAPAAFSTVVSNDIMGTLWEKWTFLSALAGITTLMQGAVGAVVATQHGDALVRRLYAECLAVAERSGSPVSEKAQARSLRTLTEPGSSFSSSMQRDLQAGLRTEHDHVLGDLLRRAALLGVDAPLLSAAFAHMQVVNHP